MVRLNSINVYIMNRKLFEIYLTSIPFERAVMLWLVLGALNLILLIVVRSGVQLRIYESVPGNYAQLMGHGFALPSTTQFEMP